MAKDDNTVRLVIYPSGTGEESLTVSDAMQQVLDHFTLLSKAEARDPTSNVKVVWRLTSASTNSPFTIEASAVSSNPEMSVDRQALQARHTLSDGLARLYRGEAKPLWFDADADAAMRRILARNLNGIGRTDIVTGDGVQPIILDHRSARKTQGYLDLLAAKEAAAIEDLSRREFGSVEGRVIGVTTHYKKPALVLRERLSGREVKCVLSTASADAIGAQHQWSEVWKDQRVAIAGLCHYDKVGTLTLVEVEEITRHQSRDVPISALRDPNFSGGLTSQEHLDRLWGEEHG